MNTRFGRYELLRPLGRGGMAEVFLARYVGPEGFEKRLVIKRILPRLSDDRRLLRLFFEEARTHVSLSHGNLVSVFDFGRVSNDYFIAMEHVHGADLATLLASERAARRKLAPSLVAHLGIELCRGLGYVHRRGFVHSDVSPRNVLLSVDGEVKLSDFGLAQASASDVAPTLRGTLGYMSPEQARGERLDGRADLYSLGVVLAEALLGERARSSVGDEDGLAMARAGKPLHLEGPLAEVIARATQTAPDDRFSTAEEMLSALEREAARFGEGREASVRDLAARTTALAPRAVASDGPRGKARAAAITPAITAIDGSELAAETAPASIDATRNLRESYFRDHGTSDFVESVLAMAPAPGARRFGSSKAWLVAGAAGVLVTGGALIRTVKLHAAPTTNSSASAAVIARSAPAPHPTSPDAPKLTSVGASIPPAAPPPPAAPSPAPALASASAAKESLRSSHRALPASPPPRRSDDESSTGTLLIRCTPWCVPFVDDRARGDDGKSHTLVLAAGRHHVEGRRLDDRRDQTVDVQPGQSQTVEFHFELPQARPLTVEKPAL